MSFLRWTVATIVVLAALVTASLTSEPSSWRSAVHWAREFRATSRDAAATCPVLIGDAVPGSLREAFDRVGKMELALGGNEREQLRAFAERKVEDPAAATALLAKVPEAALDAMRQLARIDGKIYTPGNLGARNVGSVFGDQLVLLDALMVSARVAPTEQERVNDWLDAIAIGLDLAGSETALQSLVGLMAVARATGIADDHWLQALSRPGLEQLAVALAKADAATPLCIDLESIAANLLLFVEESDSLQPSDIGLRSVYQSWQNAFSIEDEAIDRVGRCVEQIRAFLAGGQPNEPWPGRRDRLQQLVDDDEVCNADLMMRYLSFVREGEQTRRECVAEIRILRMAVAQLMDEELVLADPLGSGVIRVLREGAQVRLSTGDGARERCVTAK